ncbi:MAG: cytochrome c [Thermodesulfobacteriota bacterium]|nr:cytochrome c [Thermodesulfobacteriota bacterium]
MQMVVRIFAILLLVLLFNYTTTTYSYCADGAKLFRSKCGECHHENGEAPAISPVDYASTQWKRFFDREKHTKKKYIGNKVSPSEMRAVKVYLMDHAADSDHPIAAGSTGRR